MGRKIRITAGAVRMEADLLDAPTADLLWEGLPTGGRANIWGEEIYFAIPLDAPAEPAAREEMAVGEIAYCPPGKAFCIFFGRTPTSVDDAPRAASAVNPLGRLTGDAGAFPGVPGGTEVLIERAE